MTLQLDIRDIEHEHGDGYYRSALMKRCIDISYAGTYELKHKAAMSETGVMVNVVIPILY